MRLKNYALLLLLTGCFCNSVNSQELNSENGWWLPVRDTLHVLLVYAEVEYDLNPDADPSPKGVPNWRPGTLPAFADEVFAPSEVKDTTTIMSWYYREMSMGSLTVLGDFYPEVITLRESDWNGAGYGDMKKAVARELKENIDRKTQNGFSFSHFDNWQNAKKKGRPKEKVPDDELSVDHVMVVTRNLNAIPQNNGRASRGSIGYGNSFSSDTYSVFGAGNSIPFGIMKHELNHLFIGGNNFHVGGGNAPVFERHFLHMQGGWGMMGAANASLLTCNGWDRWWLGWKPPGSEWAISAVDPESDERIPTDLDFSNPSDTGVYVLRDFISTGDVMRIKLPKSEEENFNQYLWLENHRGRKFNGSPFDKFHYQDDECMPSMAPGLFAYMQIGADRKIGNRIYRDPISDFLRPMTADGYFDRVFLPDSQSTDWCLNNVTIRPFRRVQENTLTGSGDQEFPAFEVGLGGKDRLTNKEINGNTIEVDGHPEYSMHLNFGMPWHSFKPDENNEISIHTNPSSAVMRTYRAINRLKESDDVSETVVPNGLSIELLRTLEDGAIEVRVRFDNVTIDENITWRADSIEVIPNPYTTPDLILSEKTELVLDQGLTPTRMSNPREIDGMQIYAGPTHMVIRKGTTVELKSKSLLKLKSDARLTVEKGATLIFGKKAQMELTDSSRVFLEEGAILEGLEQSKINVSDEAKIDATDGGLQEEIDRALSRSGCFFGIFR